MGAQMRTHSYILSPDSRDHLQSTLRRCDTEICCLHIRIDMGAQINSHSLAHTHTHFLFLSLSLSLSHTHALTPAHTLRKHI